MMFRVVRLKSFKLKYSKVLHFSLSFAEAVIKFEPSLKQPFEAPINGASPYWSKNVCQKAEASLNPRSFEADPEVAKRNGRNNRFSK